MNDASKGSFGISARLSVMMFLQFFIWGSWYVTGPNYLSSIGFEAADFGWMYSVGPIAGMLSPFFVGMIADRFLPSQIVLAILHLAGAGGMFYAKSLMLIEDPSPTTINTIFFCYMLAYYPTLALVNTVAMSNVKDTEKSFPVIRVFGTLGWIAAGTLISARALDTSVGQFDFTIYASVALAVYALTLPNTPPPARGKAFSAKEALGFDALALLKNRSFAAFMIGSFLICIPLAFYYQMAARYVTDSGIEAPAFKMTFGQWSEVGFMLALPIFLKKFGVKATLLVGMAAWVLRYVLFSFGADEGVVWMVMTGIILHGICYDFFFVTGQIYTDKVAPEAIRSQAQGMLVFFTLGLGMFIGAQVAGQIEAQHTVEAIVDGETLKTVEWAALWMKPAAMAGAVLLLFAFLFSAKDVDAA